MLLEGPLGAFGAYWMTIWQQQTAMVSNSILTIKQTEAFLLSKTNTGGKKSNKDLGK